MSVTSIVPTTLSGDEQSTDVFPIDDGHPLYLFR
jgi:hypothetical protein